MKTLFIDCETTGTDPERHDLIQLAGVLYSERTELERFDLLARPFFPEHAEPEALDVTGRTLAELDAFPDPIATFADFEAMLGRHVDRFNKRDKVHFVGYNADFDADFVRAWFDRCRAPKPGYFGAWFWWPIIDVAKLAGLRLMEQRAELRDFKLMTVAEYLGVQTSDGEAHDAFHDIRVTMRLFRKLSADLGLFSFSRDAGTPAEFQAGRQRIADQAIEG